MNVDGRLVLSTIQTLPTAEHFIKKWHSGENGARTLHHYAGDLYTWENGRYAIADIETVKRRVFQWLHGCADEMGKPFPSNPTTVEAAVKSIKLVAHLDNSLSRPPAWIVDPREKKENASLPPAGECLPLVNGILHIPTRRILPHSPRLFVTHGVDFEYQPDAPLPAHWLRFLNSIFDGDQEQIQLLQEWSGYVLTPDTRQHKMLLMVGPPRSGKGTIATVLQDIVGPQNVCNPTTSSLIGEFGLAPLVGKTLAIIGDARFSGNGIVNVTERLLTISGEDNVTVNRKYQDAVSIQLPTRFMILSNELPRLTDASTALAKRFVTLSLTKSFYGQEDLSLKDRFKEERPGIFNWCLAGFDSLRARGKFIPPKASRLASQEMEDLASPVGLWLRECCTVGTGRQATTGEAFQSWREWCESNGRQDVGTKQTLGRNLRAVNPEFTTHEGTKERFYKGFRVGKEIEGPVDF